MSKEVKTTVVDSRKVFETNDDGDLVFTHPAKYYIIDSLGQYVYYHCRQREVAQNACNEFYGIGKYKIRTTSQTGGSSGASYSARGSNSRRGFASHLKKSM